MVPTVALLTPDVSELGARMGISFFANGVGILIGPPISGALLTANYNWWVPGVFSGIAALAGGMVYIIIRMMIFKSRIEE
ncbi:hypothetical protein AZE42_13839 [Rhizopogon vesiculosus]|uniref:Major facilitator superfamily (MFS) profile domain-containing protein n=1 Tax=Rhizopogon vesiculosus TaxID=180088 RepID=A0A1J8Q5G6_9AGAM|nr:hypothetical protein AZE42_13839 [Rhizopogon vesiculosus]